MINNLVLINQELMEQISTVKLVLNPPFHSMDGLNLMKIIKMKSWMHW
jgi:hypothetical protein